MAEYTAYIGLGSNLGDRRDSINSAIGLLAETPHIEVTKVSDIIETAPLAGRKQPDYLNAVAEIKTTLTAEDLHRKLADIETSLGRTRREKWSPRTIDIDLLLFGDEIINNADLTVPHPQMHLRSFVLKGLCQLNAGLLHPVMKESMNELAARLGGADFVLNPEPPQLISIAGVIGVGKTTLAKKLAGIFHCECLLEPYDANPFMPDVYAGRKEMALDSQLFFLTHRLEQLNHNTLAPGQIAISDYIFDKEFIYANRLLSTAQLALYERIYQLFSSKVTAPALVIYMRDSEQRCLERIHKRNRPYEQRIEMKFLEELSYDYERLFSNWKTCPVIRTSIDVDVNHLADQIKTYVVV